MSERLFSSALGRKFTHEQVFCEKSKRIPEDKMACAIIIFHQLCVTFLSKKMTRSWHLKIFFPWAIDEIICHTNIPSNDALKNCLGGSLGLGG